ncbi:MAG: hypothetical protein ACR2QW_17580 [bacterium]
MKTATRGIIYCVLVFGVGFLLGPIRLLWLVPRLGERLAELVEMPVMLAVIILSARFVTKHFPAQRDTQYLHSGIIALGLLLIAELYIVYFVREMSIGQYTASRDPLAGLIYLMMLLVFALMPWWLGRRKSRSS